LVDVPVITITANGDVLLRGVFSQELTDERRNAMMPNVELTGGALAPSSDRRERG